MKNTTYRLALPLILLLSFISSFAQDPPQYGTPFAGVPDPRDANIYQVHIRPYSAAGNLAGVTARLDAIKALGTNVLYLMPIYPHGTDPRSSASPYCIKDYKSVAAEYGSLTDLRALVDGAHSRGMAVMLDIAINGTSWDHPWITQHPDWYVQGGGVIQQLATFPDIAALNFNNASMRAALVDAMRYWIFAANIDGYRCDFANNPPLDFWTNTINNLRGISSHKLLMLAEGDRLENFQCGFDFNFGDKWFYDVLKPIAANGASVVNTTNNTTGIEYTYASATQQVVRYTANHDTETDPSLIPMSVFKSHAGVIANYILCAYMRGVPFLTSGQEVDFNQSIPWPYQSVKINWTANTSAAADFTKVIDFRNSSAAIRRGTMTNYSDANVCAFTKVSGSEKVEAIVNLKNATSNYTIPAALAGTYKDAYSGATVTLTSGAVLSLAPFQYLVVTNTNVPTVPVTGVTVSPTSVSVAAGLTTQLTATVLPANATNQTVAWSSSNTAVATVSASGVVTGVAAGTATITAKTNDGAKTATCAVTVTAASTFTVHFYKPSNWGTAIKIYWWAAQPSGVLANGTWPGVAMTSEGNGWYSYTFTNITSTNLIFNDGTNQTADLTRNKTGWYLNGTWYDTNPGTPVAVTSVTVSPSNATINAGATTQLTATIAPSNATNKTVAWSSSNTSVATVNASGLVTAIAAGTASITVTTQDGNKTAISTITIPGGTVTWYQIVNRWQPGAYLYDGGNGQVKYGSNPGTNTAYQWTKVDAGGGFTYLKNRSTGNYMHVENQNGSVQTGANVQGWYSAMWTLAVTDNGYQYIKNRWMTEEWVHIENLLGYAQYAGPQNGWYSAQWQFVNPVVVSGIQSNQVLQPDVINEDVMVYPNPSSGGKVYLQLRTPAARASVVVRSIAGAVISNRTMNASGDMEYTLKPGVYLITVSQNGKPITRKLVVQ